MTKVLDYDTVVDEFERQPRYCIRFWTDNLGKDMHPLIQIAMG